MIPTLAAAPHEAIIELFKGFGVDGPHLLAQLVNFSILAFVLWRFAVKPALGTLEQRTAIIEKGLADAAAAKQRLASAQQEAELRLTKASEEAVAILAQARAAAKQVVESAAAEGATKAEDILRRGQEAIEADRRRMLAEAKAELSRLVVETTAKVLDQTLDDAARSRVSEAATKTLAR
jgi:F-type H+-transporting ATPase subunit b